MRFFKKFIRKLYHLIWFLSAFLFFLPKAKAETINDMTFSNFRTYASSYSIISNSEIYSTTAQVPIDMSAVASGSPFEWITSYNMTCTGNTVITGRFRFDGNPNVNYDFLQENIKEVYYAPNITGVSSTPCSWSVNPNNLQVSFTCTTNQPNSNFIVGGRWRYRTGSFSTQYLIWRNMNITCDNSASAIIDNNNNNTQSIINNNNQNTQEIIDNQQQNTQEIIDNQNDNTDKQIESQKVCSEKVYTKNDIVTDGYRLSSDGNLYSDTSYGITDYINIKNATDVNFLGVNSNFWGNRSCFYNDNKSLISCIEPTSAGSVTVPSNAYFLRISISKNSNLPQVKVVSCKNGNQAIDDSLNNIDDTLNDSSVDSSDSTINNLKNQIPTNSVISDLLLLPIRFLQNFVNALNSSCSSFSLGSLLGTNLVMPCINLESYLGSTIWTMIDLIFSGMFVYGLRKKFIQIYENITNLRNGGNEID